MTVAAQQKPKMTNTNPHRSNGFLWLGTTSTWLAGVLFCFFLDQIFPGEHPLEIGNLKATGAFLFLFAGGVAMAIATGGWLGNLGALLIAAVNLTIAVAMLTSIPVDGFAVSRWPRILTAEAIMVATVWSAIFGWLAAWRGDRRLIEIQGQPNAA